MGSKATNELKPTSRRNLVSFPPSFAGQDGIFLRQMIETICEIHRDRRVAMLAGCGGMGSEKSTGFGALFSRLGPSF